MSEEERKELRELFVAALYEAKTEQEEELEMLWDVSVHYHRDRGVA